jgi:integrase
MHLGHFFKWLTNAGIYVHPSNPATGLSFEGIDLESHEEFSDSELKTIFESREFQTQRHKKKPARYWLLMILAYTGARRGEIADLALSDIGEEDAIRFFDLKDDETRKRRLKTKISKRRVPIHSHLIKLGLLDFFDGRRAKGAKLLFDTAKGRGSCGDAVSKWFARLLKELRMPGKHYTACVRLSSRDCTKAVATVRHGGHWSDIVARIFTRRCTSGCR